MRVGISFILSFKNNDVKSIYTTNSQNNKLGFGFIIV